MGWISDECADKLCGLVAGTLLIGGGLAVGGGLLPVGVGMAEAFVGAAGLATTMLRRRGKAPDAVFARMRRSVADGVRLQLDAERPGWAAEADAEAALSRLDAVAGMIRFEGEAIVAAGLRSDGVVRHLMLRAAEVDPQFHPDTGNETFRRIIDAALRQTFAALRADPDFWESLRPALDRATQDKLDGILGRQQDLLGLAKEVDATTRRTEIKVDESLENTRALRQQATATDARLDQILALLQTRDPAAVAAAKDAGIPESTIIELARRILPDVEDADAALRELESAVAIAVRVAREGRHGTNLGPFIDDVLARVAALSREGRFEEASGAADDAFAAWEREEAARRQEEDERRARSREAGIRLLRAAYDQDLLARNARSAAERRVRIVDLEHEDPDARYRALRAAQNEAYEEGRDRGTRLPLELAIELARLGLERARIADERGTFGNNLGNALWTLGARESGTARLEAAVEAYRLALEEVTRERMPLSWAGTQNNLGNALRILGQRESGAARLEEAVEAYALALEERTRPSMPLDWAKTQMNLGAALAILGQRESGTARLEQAVEAYCLALEEVTRERVPLDWAAMQNNLGNALQTLGVRESRTARLEEAVAAYRLALEERTRERTPFPWAQTMENIAIAHLALFGKTGEPSHVDEALAAVDGALEVYREAGADYDIGTATRLREAILAARG